MRKGKVYFQSSGREDVFLSVDLRGDGVVKTTESFLGFQGLKGSDKAWINGVQPTRHLVNVEDLNGFLHCWLKTENYTGPFEFRIYLELELIEEVASVSDLEQIAEASKPEGPCDYNDKCLLDLGQNTS